MKRKSVILVIVMAMAILTLLTSCTAFIHDGDDAMHEENETTLPREAVIDDGIVGQGNINSETHDAEMISNGAA